MKTYKSIAGLLTVGPLPSPLRHRRSSPCSLSPSNGERSGPPSVVLLTSPMNPSPHPSGSCNHAALRTGGAGHQSLVSNYQLQITNHQLPIVQIPTQVHPSG